MSDARLTIGAVMYPGFEMLDMFGPLEMFAMLGTDLVQILTVAETSEPVATAIAQDLNSGPKVLADCTFDTADQFDVVLVPGGFGTLPQLDNDAFLAFLRQQAERAKYVCSVCTGSLLLARAGLLAGRRATTNKQLFALTAAESADVSWIEKARWVEDGPIFTSSGVSAGMDMSLALICQVFGEEAAVAAANAAEYTWQRDADEDPFLEHLNEAAKLMRLV